MVINVSLFEARSDPSQTVCWLSFSNTKHKRAENITSYTPESGQLFVFFKKKMFSLPSLGQGSGFGQPFSVSAVEVACELGGAAGKLGSPSSGGSGEMAGALLSSSMGVGAGGGAKEWAWRGGRWRYYDMQQMIVMWKLYHWSLDWVASHQGMLSQARRDLTQHESLSPQQEIPNNSFLWFNSFQAL